VKRTAVADQLAEISRSVFCKVSNRLSVQEYMDLSHTGAAEALRLTVRVTANER
jgi:hypothetical protein